MKRFGLILLSASILSSSAIASDLSVKLMGGFDFQAGYLKSNAPSFNPKNISEHPNYISHNQKNHAFSSTANMAIEVKNTLDNGFIYGAKIGLETSAKSSRKHQSSIFIESEAGRLEFGSDKSAMTKMRITPFTIAAATAGSWDGWVKGDPIGQIPYVTNFTNFLDAKMRLPGKIEYSRKITYYTPEYKGFQIGISYIPDSSNVGYGDIKENVNHTPIMSDYYYSVKNGFAGGITYNTNLSDVAMKISAVGEIGKVISRPKNPSVTLPSKIRKLKNYTVGVEFDYQNFSIASSYGDYMRSFTSSSDPNPSTEMYGLGAAYKFTKLKTSIAYFTSKHRKNAISAASFAVDYKVAPGLLPYAEITSFNAKGRSLSSIGDKKNHKGVLIISGIKLEF